MDLFNIYIYIYKERERERERDGSGDMGVVPNMSLYLFYWCGGKKYRKTLETSSWIVKDEDSPA
jgi:hypothetical protein